LPAGENLLLLLNELGRDMHEWGVCLIVAGEATVAKGVGTTAGTTAAAILAEVGEFIMTAVVVAWLAVVAVDSGCTMVFSDSLLLLQFFVESLWLLPLTVEAADAKEEAAARVPGDDAAATSGGACIDSCPDVAAIDSAPGVEDAVGMVGVSDWLRSEAGMTVVSSLSAD